MFDGLTITELDELADKLDGSIYALTHTALNGSHSAVLAEMRETEHDVWHTRCRKSGVRCLHRHNAA